MYNRILNYLPDKEAELLRMSAELEKINIMTDCMDDSYEQDSADIMNSVKEIRKIDQDNVKKQRETLKTMISKLNEENTDLRIQLEHLKTSNLTEQQKIVEFTNENGQLSMKLSLIKRKNISDSKNFKDVNYKA
jgi:hypothetical protein